MESEPVITAPGLRGWHRTVGWAPKYFFIEENGKGSAPDIRFWLDETHGIYTLYFAFSTELRMGSINVSEKIPRWTFDDFTVLQAFAKLTWGVDL